MSKEFTAIVYRGEKYFIAECPEIGTASQGKTREEAIKHLREATEAFLEAFPSRRFTRTFITPFQVGSYGKTTNSFRA